MRLRGIVRVAAVAAMACCLFAGSARLASAQSNVADAVNGFINELTPTYPGPIGSSISSNASFGLFESTRDFFLRPDLLAEVQRDEQSPRLGQPGSGGTGTPRIVFTSLANRTNASTFELGGIYRLGPGNLGVLGTFDQSDFRDTNTNIQYPQGYASSGGNKNWTLIATYAWPLSSALDLGFGLEYGKRDSDSASSYYSATSSPGYLQFVNQSDPVKFWTLKAGVLQKVSSSFWWGATAYYRNADLTHTRNLYHESSSWCYDSGATCWEGGKLKDKEWGLMGHANWYFTNEDVEVSAHYEKGDYSLTKGPFRWLVDSDNLLEARADFNNSKITRDGWGLGLRWRRQLGDNPEIAAGLYYNRWTDKTNLQWSCLLDEESGSSQLCSGYDTSKALFLLYLNNESSDYKETDLVVPVALRIQVLKALSLIVGANFDRYTDDTKAQGVTIYPDYPGENGAGGYTEKHTSTDTSYAAALRYAISEHAAGEIGFLSRSTSDVQTLNGNIWTLSFTASF